MRRLTAAVLEIEAKRVAMSGILGPEKKKPKRSGRITLERLRREMAGASERVESGDWASASAAAIVGLYAVLHEKVYGVAPEELAEGWLGAVSAARRLVDESPFDGQVVRVVDFVRFTWKREREVEEKQKGTGNVRRRIGWRLQFVSRALVTDYKRAMLARRKT